MAVAKKIAASKRDRTFMTLHSALQDLHTGILQLDKSGKIRYANDTFCRIAGIADWQGLELRDLLPDAQAHRRIMDRLSRRVREGVGEDYMAELARPSDDRRVAVNVVAMPEIGPAGRILGSLALVRDRTVETGSKAIHGHINEAKNTREMLDKVCAVIKSLVPFSYLSVSVYSADERHSREVYRAADIPLPDWSIRWYELPDVARAFISNRSTTLIDDVHALLASDRWKEIYDQPATQQFLKTGLRACVWHPMVQQGHVSASMTLYSKSVGGFNERDKALIDALPIRRALSMVLSNLSRDELQFRLSLIRDIARSDADIVSVAELITDRVKAQYEWNNVSLFQVDENRKCFRLLSQSPSEGPFAYDPGYTQSLDEGVLAHVLERKESVNIRNLARDPALGPRFRKGMAAQPLSELAIPIVVDGQVRAILNSEDVRESAYSAEEQVALEQILAEVASLYQRLELHQTLRAIQEAASDGIVRTDYEGRIVQVNPAGAAMLGHDPMTMLGQRFPDYVGDTQVAAALRGADRIAPDEVRLRRADGSLISVLLSGSPLPEQLGGRVYMISDLSLRKKLEHLESLGRIYRELGAQSHPAISLCFSWLRGLMRNADGPLRDSLDKTLRQLRKVQLTFDRVSLAERAEGMLPFNPVLISLPRVVQSVLSDFPAAESEHVASSADDGVPNVRADIFQITFCIKSIAAYLLRFVPEDARVEIHSSSSAGAVEVQLRGKTPELPDAVADETGTAMAQAHARFELAIGLSAIGDFMKQNGGSLQGPVRDGATETFVLRLPAATRG